MYKSYTLIQSSRKRVGMHIFMMTPKMTQRNGNFLDIFHVVINYYLKTEIKKFKYCLNARH